MSGAVDAARRNPLRWLVALLVLLVALGTVGWAVLARHTVQVGDRYYDRSVMDDNTSRALNLQLPTAKLDLRVTHGDTAGAYDDEVKAPDGATLVQVTWTPTRLGVAPVWPAASQRQRQVPATDLSLVTEGRRYSLATSMQANDVGSSAVVVVKGDASDARVEAWYDGRTVRAASGSADIVNPSPTGGCDDPSERHSDRVFLYVACAMPVHRSVYVPGLGAAPHGKEWLVLYAAGVARSERDATVYPPGSDAEGAHYTPSGRPTVAVTAAGVAAKPKLAGKDVIDGDSVRLADRAWLVPEGEASTVRLRYRLPMSLNRQRTDLPDQPARHDIDVRGEATCPAP